MDVLQEEKAVWARCALGSWYSNVVVAHSWCLSCSWRGFVVFAGRQERSGNEALFFTLCWNSSEPVFCCENSNAIRYNKIMNWTHQVRHWWQVTIKTENLEVILHKLIPEVIMVTPKIYSARIKIHTLQNWLNYFLES